MNIPIFFSSNDNYIPYVSVMMQSIMENAKKYRKYEFYILHIDIKKETMEALQDQVNLFPNFLLNFINMLPHVESYNFFVSRHLTVETYFRLFIPYIFPNIEKVIYLDGDMVCLTDISQLFDTDISDYLLGGTRDTAVSWYYAPDNKKKGEHKIFELLLSMEHPENYINAGMLLINCKKFREKYTIQHVINTIFSREWQIHDQDVINVLAKDNIYYFNKEWDYMLPDIYEKYLPEKYLSEHLQAKENPKILHYKPYAAWYYIQHFDEFWKYATRTPFIKEIVSRMNKNGIVNRELLVDKVCTTIRERSGFGGVAILKTILAFFTRRSGN